MIDWVSRVTREETILDMFYEGLEFSPPETFAEFLERVSANTYLHYPTNKMVQIKGIDDKTLVTDPHPDSKYKDWIDYYQKCFGLKVTDELQWLAYSLGPWKEKVEKGVTKRYKERIYFVPEFLKGTGLTDEEKNDYKVMNAVAIETKLSPE